MKFATLNNGSRDGELILVSRDYKRAVKTGDIAPTLQYALDHWNTSSKTLETLNEHLNAGRCRNAFPLDYTQLHSPLPRAYSWMDGSAYINHILLVRKARGAEPPSTLKTDPLMYQGGSDSFLAPRQDIPVENIDWGADFESEVAVITDDVPMGTTAEEAQSHILLVLLCNDVTLRNLVPDELAKGFGFFQSKPSSAFSPIAVTPDELGDDWKQGRLHLPLITKLNGQIFGTPDAGPEMHFSFYDLIAHAAKTRPLAAGTIVGSGTLSNQDVSKGSSCLAEKRMLEKINNGTITTPFLQYGDEVEIEMLRNGQSIFGKIHQKVVPYEKP